MIIKLELTCQKCNHQYEELLVVNKLRPNIHDIPLDNCGCPKCGHLSATTTVPKLNNWFGIYGSNK